MWVHHILLSLSSSDGHLGDVHFRVILNNAAVNIHVLTLVWTCIPISPECISFGERVLCWVLVVACDI